MNEIEPAPESTPELPPELPANRLTLQTEARRWIVWRLLGSSVAQLLQWVGNLGLGRLLAPDAFGLFGLITIVTAGLTVISDVGLRQSVIQNDRGDDPQFLNTTWTWQIIRGLGLGLVCVGLAGPLAQWYGQPQLRGLLWLTGLSLTIAGLNATLLLRFSRHLQFRQLTLFEAGLQVVQILVMVVWTQVNASIWAIAGAGVLTALIGLVWSHVWSRRVDLSVNQTEGQPVVGILANQLAWEPIAVRSLASFGIWIWLANMAPFLTQQAQNLVYPRLLPFEQFGTYGIALALVGFFLPLLLLQKLGQELLFPWFSRRLAIELADSHLADSPSADSGPTARSAFNQLSPSTEPLRRSLRAELIRIRWPLLIGGGVLVIVFVGFGDLVLSAFYDARYTQVQSLFVILGLGLWPALLAETANPLLLAIGQPRYAALGHLLRLVFLGLVLLIGLSRGGFSSVVALATIATLSQLLVYGSIVLGLGQEEMPTFRQDALATALCLGGLLLVAIGRILLGMGGTPGTVV